MGELVAILISIPFVLVADWFKFLRELPPRQAELTRASHGVVLIVLAAILPSKLEGLVDRQLLLTGAVAPFWFGLYWLCIGYARSYGPRDMQLICRAALRFVVGVVLSVSKHRFGYPHEFVYILVNAFAWWMMITAGVKLLLLLRGVRPLVVDPVVTGIGIRGLPRDGFGDGTGLR